MFKKCVFMFLGLAFLASCIQEPLPPEVPVIRVESWQPRVAYPESVVVCRQKQCAPASLSMSKEFIYNSLLHLLDNNNQNKLLPCMADPRTHVCTEEYLALPVTVGVTPAFMYINDVKLADISVGLNRSSLDLILNYNVTYNGQTPVCKPAKTLIYVKNSKNIIMEDAGYACKMTTIGSSIVKTLFAIDYIDLDYGYIGGYYSIGVSGPAFGGGSGYMLLRLPKDAYPLAPELMFTEETVEEVEETAEEPEEEVLEEVEEEPVEEITEEEVKEDVQQTPSKIKVTVKTTSNSKAPNAEQGQAQCTEESPCTDSNPEVSIEYLDSNGVQIFPLIKPKVKVTEIKDIKPQKPAVSETKAPEKVSQ